MLISTITLSLVMLFVGFSKFLSIKKINTIEISLFLIIIILLVLAILSPSILSVVGGRCEIKSCEDLKNKQECKKELPYRACEWISEEKDGRCIEIACTIAISKDDCEKIAKSLGCVWNESVYKCIDTKFEKMVIEKIKKEKECAKFHNNKKECSMLFEPCKWIAGPYIGREKIDTPRELIVWIVNSIIFFIIVFSVMIYGVYHDFKEAENLSLMFFSGSLINTSLRIYKDMLEDFLGKSALVVLAILLLLIVPTTVFFTKWTIDRWKKFLRRGDLI